MAQLWLSKLKKVEKNRNTIHEKAIATYTTFEHDGRVYFQLDTYGRIEREMPEKISQSLQLDREAAQELIKLLKETFSLN